MSLNCKNCYKRIELAKLDIHFDWLDCPYRCVYGDKMLNEFKKSGCKNLREFYQRENE